MLNKYFDEPEEKEPPRLQVWRDWKAGKPECRQISVELTRDHTGLVLEPPKIIVRLEKADGTLIDFKEVAWEPALERWLIDEEKAKSRTEESEAIRTDMLLREAFRPARRQVGPDYFDSVLVEEVREGPLAQYPSVAEVLGYIHTGEVSEQSRETTRASIVNAMRTVARRLRTLYPENMDAAERILALGIASFLDERFSVTNRRLMGFR